MEIAAIAYNLIVNFKSRLKVVKGTGLIHKSCMSQLKTFLNQTMTTFKGIRISMLMYPVHMSNLIGSKVHGLSAL